MSVIAWDGLSLATDKMVSEDGMHWIQRKVWKTDSPVGAVSGVGLLDDILALRAWYLGGQKEADYPDVKSSRSLLVVIVKEDVQVLAWGASGPRAPREYDGMQKLAWGSAAPLALGAMLAGATAKEAVDICIDRSPNAGYQAEVVQVFKD